MKTLIGLSIVGYVAYIMFDIDRRFKNLEIIDNIKANQELEDLMKRKNDSNRDVL